MKKTDEVKLSMVASSEGLAMSGHASCTAALGQLAVFVGYTGLISSWVLAAAQLAGLMEDE